MKPEPTTWTAAAELLAPGDSVMKAALSGDNMPLGSRSLYEYQPPPGEKPLTALSLSRLVSRSDVGIAVMTAGGVQLLDVPAAPADAVPPTPVVVPVKPPVPAETP